MEVPRLGVRLELQLPAYTTATATGSKFYTPPNKELGCYSDLCILHHHRTSSHKVLCTGTHSRRSCKANSAWGSDPAAHDGDMPSGVQESTGMYCVCEHLVGEPGVDPTQGAASPRR